MAAELQNLRPHVEVELIPSSGGVFEVEVDGNLIFSKKALDRFPEPGEIVKLLGWKPASGG